MGDIWQWRIISVECRPMRPRYVDHTYTQHIYTHTDTHSQYDHNGFGQLPHPPSQTLLFALFITHHNICTSLSPPPPFIHLSLPYPPPFPSLVLPGTPTVVRPSQEPALLRHRHLVHWPPPQRPQICEHTSGPGGQGGSIITETTTGTVRVSGGGGGGG